MIRGPPRISAGLGFTPNHRAQAYFGKISWHDGGRNISIGQRESRRSRGLPSIFPIPPQPILKQMSTTIGIVNALAIFALSSAAQAASIIGSINFSSGNNGGIILQNSLGKATTNLATSTGVQSWLLPEVDSTSGAFAAVPNGQAVSFSKPYVFNPSTPMSPLWTIAGFGDFTFTLTSSTVAFQSKQFLLVSGVGVLTGTGFDPTPATWYFSTQGPPVFNKFSWSASVTGVPETGTPMILSASLLCICFLRRRN